ncbi:nitrate- and nitrite sensing domain-containing protein [Streptomyces sp. NPDC000983]|uniref:sensor histidine kinase n=1 Tax=Streptomyces sp. NPDC000983 TaxID=3154373 RepID=UPI003320E3F1
MRAPVQKTRPRRSGKRTANAGGPDHMPGSTEGTGATSAGKGRPTHVRNRLIIAVAVVAAAIAAAGAPSIVTASAQVHDTQELVTLSEQTEDALTLAHSLADERDEVTSYVAAGRPKAKAPSEQRGARVDRLVEELRANPDIPASLRTDLDDIAALRRAALTGKSTALETHKAYSAALTELHGLAERLAEDTPPRAGAGAHALTELDTAVQQAASTRGLLLAALSVPSTTQTVIDPVTGLPSEVTTSSDAKQRDALTAAAQEARLRSDAALADFRETAPKESVTSYDSTVTGPEAEAAEKYLAALTDQPTLSAGELATGAKKLDDALSARVEMMRGAESALHDRRTKNLALLRDDDVTELEIRIAVLGFLVLLAIGVATGMARGLTRPLAVLRLGSARLAGAADPAAEEPVRFTGRKDEFAKVVDSVNALHAQAVTLHERVVTLESDRKHLVGQRQKMADAREELRTELAGSAAQLERLRTSIGSTFVSLALRTLGLVERQLTVIEGLEEREQDPERLATLFKLDHFATVMRRHSENLLVLAGTEHVQHSTGPVPLVDVVRAAVSEIERYERVRIAALPPHAHIAGFAADDLSHLLAELMENATSFSPPDLPVEVSGWLLESGEVMLSVQDEGIGMTEDRLAVLNTRLTELDPDAAYDHEGEQGLGLGLYVVARLAHRHGIRVQLREQKKQGGVTAVVVLPKPLLTAAPSAAVPATGPVPGGTAAFSLPGADAEANSNVLRGGRGHDDDRLVALAERAVHRAQERTEPEETRPRPTEPEARAAAGAPEAAVNPEAPVSPDAGTPTKAPAKAPVETPAETTMELLVPLAQTPEPAPEPAQEQERSEPAPTAGPVSIPAPAAAPEAAAPEAAVREADAPPATGTQPATDARTKHPRAEPRTQTRPEPPAEETQHERAEDEQLTDKGLPKRTPKISAPAQAPSRRTGSVDADALRRRLGGFRRGAAAGYRDVAAEIAEETGRTTTPVSEPEEAMGGTVEEASS